MYTKSEARMYNEGEDDKLVLHNYALEFNFAAKSFRLCFLT